MTFVGIGPLTRGMKKPNWWTESVISHEHCIAIGKASKVMLHLNRDPVWKCDGNDAPDGLMGKAESICPRIYEHAAYGIFTLSDNRRRELNTIFHNTFQEFISAKDCLGLIRYYCENKNERNRLTGRAKKHAENHTYLDRAKRLLEILDGDK